MTSANSVLIPIHCRNIVKILYIYIYSNIAYNQLNELSDCALYEMLESSLRKYMHVNTYKYWAVKEDITCSVAMYVE